MTSPNVEKYRDTSNNRVAVRLKLAKWVEALGDSERALELMVPEVEANRRSRAAVRCRRAFALQHLDREVEALIELEAAASLLPEDAKIQADLETLRTAINTSANTTTSTAGDSDGQYSEDDLTS